MTTGTARRVTEALQPRDTLLAGMVGTGAGALATTAGRAPTGILVAMTALWAMTVRPGRRRVLVTFLPL
ncbi:hypothetical protein ACIBLA_16570 [Streptomyces sp. NPDC050433]|uniref:hypothetical protein n=1 Tax=unclassified Streptomyces TaxID=2593676 RepID=UPI00343861B6